MPKPAAKPPPKAVVLATETPRLCAYLGLRGPVQQAIDTGKVSKSKLANVWLYHPSTIASSDLVAVAATATEAILESSFIVPQPVLAGMVSVAMDPPATKRACAALLRTLLESGQLGAFGLLTDSDAPYLAIYRNADQAEVSRQLDHVRRQLENGAKLRGADLPEPALRRERRAWTDAIIAHAEFCGWGRRSAGTLSPWTTPA